VSCCRHGVMRDSRPASLRPQVRPERSSSCTQRWRHSSAETCRTAKIECGEKI
jgi:hypothetical protein